MRQEEEKITRKRKVAKKKDKYQENATFRKPRENCFQGVRGFNYLGMTGSYVVTWVENHTKEN